MDAIERLQAALADRYQIERQIGAGGMATVYLARDLRHARPVALKLLNPELGAVLGPERFLSEIRVTAKLQHPNLLPLFDSGEANGQLYYVMPYVEGESLRTRLTRERQLPVPEAVRLAAAVASALDYAHRHDVVHRDLKPENILLQEGQPLVSDFGIALAVSHAGGERVTQTGLSLGTPQYMSPEQATGERNLDGRTDIYSLGAVLYEMLTGEPPHTGPTVQAIIARVLTDKPRSVRESRPSVPEYVDAAILKALEKVPADRFDNARDFADVLQGNKPIAPRSSAESASHARVGFLPKNSRAAWLTAGVTSAVAVIALGYAWREHGIRSDGDNPLSVAFTLETPADARFSPGYDQNSVAVSPDGQWIVYLGDRNGATQLFLRRLDDLQPHPLAGTEQAQQPFFSPDGKWIAFFAGSQLKKISRDGGLPIVIANGLAARPAAWGPNNEIIIPRISVTGSRAGLSQLSAGSGKLRTLTLSDSVHGVNHMVPVVLPDRKTLLFVAQGPGSFEDDSLAITSVDGGDFKVSDIICGRPLGYLDGNVIYSTTGGNIMAVPMDIRARKITGDPVVLSENVSNGFQVWLSPTGTLAYVSGEAITRMTWGDQSGRARSIFNNPSPYKWPRLSPKGDQIAVTVATSASDVWLYAPATGAATRLTTGGGERPEWTPDGTRIIYTIPNTSRRGLWWQPADGSAPPQQLHPRTPRSLGVPEAAVMAPDGRTILFVANGGINRRDIYSFKVGDDADASPWLATQFDERSPRISPDGKWVAYVSDESGDYEVFVRPYPAPGARVQISTTGGLEPVWSHDGRRIYYRSGQQMMSADVATARGFSVASRKTLFMWPSVRDVSHAGYDIAPDGRLLLLQATGENAKIVIITNWFNEIRKKLSQNGQ